MALIKKCFFITSSCLEDLDVNISNFDIETQSLIDTRNNNVNTTSSRVSYLEKIGDVM